tara:strand:+ start:241 stop:456 length:216 start_codon:yes stop_codon:yes gene_type:complete
MPENKRGINLGGWGLFRYARENRIDVAHRLIQTSATIEAQDKDGWTSLHIATSNNYLDVVGCLIEHRANTR